MLRFTSGDPAVGALAVAFAAKTVAFVLATSAVASALDRTLSIPDLAALAIHLFGDLLFSAAILTAVAFWTHPSDQAWTRARRYQHAAAIIALVMVALWTATAAGSNQRVASYLVVLC
jgi:hypothetical protein